MHADARLARVAQRQFGVFSLKQALKAGLSIDEARYRVRIGRWTRLHRGVYLMSGAPQTPHGRIAAATLAAGEDARASHGTAAFLFGLGDDGGSGDVHVVVPHRRGLEIAGVQVHRPRGLARADHGRIGPIPVTTPARTLLDLASTLDPLALEEALDEALRRGLVRVPALRRLLEARPSTRGITSLRSLLLDRQTARTESPLEDRFLRLLVAARFPVPLAQYEIRSGGRVIARVDFAFVQERLAVELDGYAYHSGKSSFDAGHVRDQRIIDAGWFPIHFTDRQVRNAPDGVIATVRRTLARRGAK